MFYDLSVYVSFVIYGRWNVFLKYVFEVMNVFVCVFRFVIKGLVNFFIERVGFWRNLVE